MYSAARVNQFQKKDTCFEFVLNVSRQGNNVKIKLNLKMEFAEIAVLIILWNKWQHTRILFSFIKAYS